jgi:hypothetical protein
MPDPNLARRASVFLGPNTEEIEMSNDDDRIAAAIRRLTNLWLRDCEELERYDVSLSEVLLPANIEWVAKLDLLREFDQPLTWDNYRVRQLLREWMRSREGRFQ